MNIAARGMEIAADFTLPTKICFEPDSFDKIASSLKNQGSRFLIVSAQEENVSQSLLQKLLQSFKNNSLGVVLYQDIIGIPDSEQIDSASYFSKKSYIDAVVAFGSVASFHAAKAIALLSPRSLFAEDLWNNPNLQEGHSSLPLFCIPHEPSMGEELLAGFVLLDARANQRRFFASEQLLPQAVFYDPSICTHLNNLSAAKIAASLMAYAVEMSLSPLNNLFTSTLLNKAIEILKSSIPLLYGDTQNQQHLIQVFWASALLASVMPSIATGTAWTISMAAEAESGADLPQLMAALLPHVMEYFLTSAPARLVAVAKSLGEDTTDLSVIEASIKGIEAIRKMYMALKIPQNLTELQVPENKFGVIAQNAVLLPQLANSPKQLSRYEIESILGASV